MGCRAVGSLASGFRALALRVEALKHNGASTQVPKLAGPDIHPTVIESSGIHFVEPSTPKGLKTKTIKPLNRSHSMTAYQSMFQRLNGGANKSQTFAQNSNIKPDVIQ